MIASIKNNSLLDFEHELSLILNTYSNEVEKAKKIIILIALIIAAVREVVGVKIDAKALSKSSTLRLLFLCFL